MDVVRVCLKKEYDVLEKTEYIFNAQQAVSLFYELIGEGASERVACIYLDSTNKIICCSIVGYGDLRKTNINLADLFRVALLSNASNIFIAHNHPTEILIPTSGDIKWTHEISHIGSIMGIYLIDSIIIGKNGEYTSIREYVKEGAKNE